VLLAERIESLGSQEHTKWAAGRDAERMKKSDETAAISDG
jgi:hypothetical protein